MSPSPPVDHHQISAHCAPIRCCTLALHTSALEVFTQYTCLKHETCPREALYRPQGLSRPVMALNVRSALDCLAIDILPTCALALFPFLLFCELELDHNSFPNLTPTWSPIPSCQLATKVSSVITLASERRASRRWHAAASVVGSWLEE